MRLNESGYALLTVMVFALVMTTAGVAFFSLSTSETRQALYRQSSSEAFYLADGAVERARAKLLEDRTWRGGWTNQAAGRGAYDLRIVDTTVAGEEVVKLTGTGRVGTATRRVEVLAEVPPTSWDLTMQIDGDALVTGNLCLNGRVHVNGTADFGNNDTHLQCGGRSTDGFTIQPPVIYTDPAHFPDATYYYVKGTYIGKVKGKDVYGAKVFDRTGADVTSAVGSDLRDVTTYSGGSFTFSFDSQAKITTFFGAGGVFRRVAGNSSVVVNFGETPLYPAGGNGTASLVFDGSASSVISATIVAARFTGSSEAQRRSTAYWRGGLTTVKQIIFEPANGIAGVYYDFQKQGSSLVEMGSTDYPALTYITRDISGLNSNYAQNGCLIVLRDFNSSGGPTLTWDPGFLDHMPEYLRESWQNGVSGTLKVRRYREMGTTAA